MGGRSSYAFAGLVLAGSSLFGTVGTAQIIGPDVPAAQLAAARLLLAAGALVVIVAMTRQLRRTAGSWRHAPTWWTGVAQATFNLCFLGAMNEAGVAVGTLVAIGATPILTGLATRHISRAWLVATATAVCGLVLLIVGQAHGQSPPTVTGILLALGASASYAAYIIAGNEAQARGLATQPFLTAGFTVAAALTVPLLFVGDITWAVSGSGALLVGYLAVVPTVVAYSLFNRGLRGVRPGTAATLGLIEPVVAAALAVLVIGERLGPLSIGGVLLILIGLLMIVRTVHDAPADSSVGQNTARA